MSVPIEEGESAISEREMRAVVRLLGAIAEGGDDVASRKRRLMSGLGELVGADAWLWAVSRYSSTGGPSMCVSFLQDGFTERDVGIIMEATQDPQCQAPDTGAWMREIAGGNHITRTRRDMVEDGPWYASQSYRLYQQAVGIDDYLCSILPLGEGIYSAVGFHRHSGRPAFTARDRRIAHIIVSEIPWLHRAGVPEDAGDRVPQLTPRLRTIFGLLLEGWSRKQMADHLGLSVHTVADYTKSVYRHFNVSGQKQLIRRFRAVGDIDHRMQRHPECVAEQLCFVEAGFEAEVPAGGERVADGPGHRDQVARASAGSEDGTAGRVGHARDGDRERELALARRDVPADERAAPVLRPRGTRIEELLGSGVPRGQLGRGERPRWRPAHRGDVRHAPGDRLACDEIDGSVGGAVSSDDQLIDAHEAQIAGMGAEDGAGGSMISEEDVRAIVRLLGEAAAMGSDVHAKKRRIMSGLAELVDADAWIWVVSRYAGPKDPPMCVSFAQDGFDDRGVGLIMEASQDTNNLPPDSEPLIREIIESDGNHITRTRRDMVSDDGWYHSSHFKQYRKPLGVDEYVYSIFPLREGMFSAVGLHRKLGREPFDARQRRLAHIVVSEVKWLHHAGVPEDAGDSVPELSPRLRTVFGLLLEGWTRKQMAAHLGLSVNTIAEYTKAVYRHFEVNGQKPLIQRFRVGNGYDLPIHTPHNGSPTGTPTNAPERP
eukprot:g5586.t1